jgi:hypothetical protein
MSEDPSENSPEDGGAEGRELARRFGDDDIQRILQTAAELQERSSLVPHVDGGGLTLDDLRQVAREVGIDPRFVDLAASHVDAPIERTESVVAGGPTRWHFRTSVPGVIPEGDLDRMLQAIRSTLHQKGEVAEVWGRVEWSHDKVAPTIVGISSRDGTTEIDVSSVKSQEAGIMHGLMVPFGGIFGGAALSGLLGVSGAGVLPLIFAMSGVSYVATRFGWKARSAWWERRLRRLVERLAAVAQESARLPEGE